MQGLSVNALGHGLLISDDILFHVVTMVWHPPQSFSGQWPSKMTLALLFSFLCDHVDTLQILLHLVSHTAFNLLLDMIMLTFPMENHLYRRKICMSTMFDDTQPITFLLKGCNFTGH